MALVVLVPVGLFLRHWIGALEVDAANDPLTALAALWGGVFTVMSFLTTTGFESASWEVARNWSGLATPGLILMGLALVGGGVATTAGGVKLLRVYALYKHGVREMERLAIPASVGGDGPVARRMRRHGAYYAWIFFMLFAISIAAVMLALSLSGLEFEPALVLTIAQLVDHRPTCEHRDRSADQLCPLVTRSQSHPECRHDPWPVGNPGLDRIAEPRLLARIDHRCRVWPIFGLVTGPRAPHSLGRGWIKSGPTGTAKRKKGPEYNG